MSANVGRSLGRYRLEELLGQGGMAEVLRATDTKLGRTVAVKVILATHAVKGDFLERFLREARMVASLEHPNILPVYDFGEDNGVPFLVMPYLSGGTLRERLKAGAAPLALASAWIGQLADALDAAHAAGVLHRDVKPANVLVGKHDRLFLADFGIAKMLESESGLTATGVVVGTPIYMAPEQAQGRPATPATDRYALAVVAYEILCGRPPFAGDNVLSLMHQHVSSPPPPLSERIGGLPAGLDAVLAQALAKDPAERPPTCRALADAVAAFAPAGITPPPSLVGAGASPGSTTAPTVLSTPEIRPATVVPGTAPWGPPSTPPSVRVSDARPSLTSDATVLMAGRRKRRVLLWAAVGAVAIGALGFLLKVKRGSGGEDAAIALRPLSVEGTTPAAAAAPGASTAPAAASPITLVEIPSSASSHPSPAVPRPSIPAPDEARSRAAEQKRIAELETRVKEAEAAAQAAKSAQSAAAAKPPLPPPPNPGPDGGVPDDQGHPLLAARERLEPAKKPSHRLSGDDFQFALDEAQRVLKARPLNVEAKYLETYARGGLAYVAGKDGIASAALVEAITDLRRRKKRDARPVGNFLLKPDGTIGQPNGWQLALGYGDARGEAAGLIEKELAANPRNVRALKARAQLRRMQGLGEPQPQ
ncbi:MAG: serine/threonine-protein kinase [Thermoanaerobaculia bacterium]